MCIVFYTLNQPGFQFILASNRDEFLDRPTLPARWHKFAPISSSPGAQDAPARPDEGPDAWVLSGRDHGSPNGGTWLGITRDLRVAVLTNIRIPPVPVPAHAPSRGLLLKEFLAAPPSADRPPVHDYLARYQPQVDQYDGFNLLVFQLHPSVKNDSLSPAASSHGRVRWGKPEVGYLSNRPGPTLMELHSPSRMPTPLPEADGLPRKPPVECHGMSNTPLAQPWPKVTQGEEYMADTLAQWTERNETQDQLVERLMEMLQRTRPCESLADLSRCTCLHPVYLGKDPEHKIQEGEQGRWYGTRVTTIILVRDDGEVTFVERDIFVQNERGEAVRGSDERRFAFQAQMLP